MRSLVTLALLTASIVAAAAAQTPPAPNIDGNSRVNGVPLADYIRGLAGAVTGAAPSQLSLSGVANIPAGNTRICAAPGADLTLPVGVATGTTSEVQDCSGGAAAQPIRVEPASDAAINEQSPYVLSIPYQSTGFRKTSSNTWQPY